MRFFLIENSKTNWINVVSLIQINLNNSSNVAIDLSSNEITYEFKIKDILFCLIVEKIKNTSWFKILNLLNQTKLRNRQRATNVVFFINVEIKIIYNKRHKSLFLNSEKKTFFRFHKKYNLFEVINRKLSQQKCDSFTMKQRVKRLTYKLDIFKKWKIHSMIFVTQFELTTNDLYKRFKSNYFNFVFVKKNISIEKFYEVEQMLIKWTR